MMPSSHIFVFVALSHCPNNEIVNKEEESHDKGGKCQNEEHRDNKDNYNKDKEIIPQ